MLVVSSACLVLLLTVLKDFIVLMRSCIMILPVVCLVSVLMKCCLIVLSVKTQSLTWTVIVVLVTLVSTLLQSVLFLAQRAMRRLTCRFTF